jgi:hypothetical protein
MLFSSDAPLDLIRSPTSDNLNFPKSACLIGRQSKSSFYFRFFAIKPVRPSISTGLGKLAAFDADHLPVPDSQRFIRSPVPDVSPILKTVDLKSPDDNENRLSNLIISI